MMVEPELSGHFEAEMMPYGKCKIIAGTVQEDEWCGQFIAREEGCLNVFIADAEQ